jgi:hypothetical protein
MLAVFGPFILAGVVVLILEGHALSWVAGMFSGVFAGAWIVLRESPPAYIENWNLGAEGERKTGRALARLEQRGWRIVHDVDARRGNYDHIAVGPAGVFLLETKNLRGIVELQGGTPLLRRRHDPDATSRLENVRRSTLWRAASLKEEIERHGGQRTWVQAVVVFWSRFPGEVVDDGRCFFVHGRRLRAFMRDRPEKLTETEVARLAEVVAELVAPPTAA